jgi:pimeloyl-ACP methyl ester carboxylesterase
MKRWTIGILGFLFSMIFVIAQARQIPMDTPPEKTVVLVHGAFADATGTYDKVIPLLQAQGLKVIAVQNPLTSLADDVAATRRAIKNAVGPVILVGHSWGGAVITEAGNDPKVAALVYLAAFAPGDGQSVSEISAPYPPAPGFAELVFDSEGFATLTETGMTNFFAQDLPAPQTSLMFVTQGPTAGRVFADKISTAAWKVKPNWYVVAENDYMIQPDMQRALAAQMKATTSSYPSGHVISQSKPQETADAIIAAANSVVVPVPQPSPATVPSVQH